MLYIIFTEINPYQFFKNIKLYGSLSEGEKMLLEELLEKQKLIKTAGYNQIVEIHQS